MRIGIMGAGAIGCYLGGKLVAAGEDVVMVGRAALGAEIAAHGLTLTHYAAPEVKLDPARAVYAERADALADREVVLVTVKSMATAEAGAELARVLAAPSVVVSFQNGVGNAEVLRRALPRHAVLAGMVPFNVLREAGARFHLGTGGALAIARAHGDEAPIARALEAAGFQVHVHDDMRRVLWSKLLLNLNNSINALAGVPLREEISSRDYRRVLGLAIGEALACMRAAGIRPVRMGRMIPALAPTILGLPNALFARVAKAMVDIDPLARSSMWEDLDRRRPTEIDFLNGEVERLGEKMGVATPVNAAIRALVRVAEEARQGSPKLSAAELLARVEPR